MKKCLEHESDPLHLGFYDTQPCMIAPTGVNNSAIFRFIIMIDAPGAIKMPSEVFTLFSWVRGALEKEKKGK